MSTAELLSIAAVAVVIVATAVTGAYGLRLARTTSDFYVASRSVSPVLNASAISGEYLSAASFLGVAGLVLAYGADMLWYPVGYTVGYLVLLLLVAAPLRRSGAYTLPDFAESRLGRGPVRRISSVLVVVIGWLYLMPQLQAAGLTLRTVTGAPAWVGGLVVVVVVGANVISGGMRAITFVQAFQYWLKLTALTVPLVFIVLAWQSLGAPLPRPGTPVTFAAATTVAIRSPVTVVVRAATPVRAAGRLDNRIVSGRLTLAPGAHTLGAPLSITFPAGTVVPTVTRLSASSDAAWAEPLTPSGSRDHPLYDVYSLVLATFLGTMGLPHVLVRFYTNPDGVAARRTTLVVLGLLSLFYLLPTAYGALGRLYAPDLLLTGHTDALVLVLPGRLVPGLGGAALDALVAGGAFAAFLSTSSGLAVSVAGAISQDLLPRRRARGSSVPAFRLATVAGLLLAYVLAALAASLSVADMVSLAFTVAASSFCPLLVLGIWWRRLTDVGAAAGLLVGGGLATVAVALTVAVHPEGGWPAALLAQPAAWTVPIAFAVMITTSLATPGRVVPAVSQVMARMHLPENLRGAPEAR
ncbi:MAG: sodium/solute symporter [Actinomycetes bacterium]